LRDPLSYVHSRAALAEEALRAVLRDEPGWGGILRIRQMQVAGTGTSRDIFCATVTGPDEQEERSFAIAVPRDGVGTPLNELTLRELGLLKDLARLDVGLRIPRGHGVFERSGVLTLVRGFEAGNVLELAPLAAEPVWETMARVAAAIHRVTPAQVPSLPVAHSSWRHHVESIVEALAAAPFPEVREASAWVATHLPPPRASVLLHGDLSPRNIVVAADGRLGVIDWERALVGDPAYDLAVITNGSERPFGLDDGSHRLWEAYMRQGGAPIEPAQVRAHELGMAARIARIYGWRAGPFTTLLRQLATRTLSRAV
jgi:aminoglycoside phosphotransferase (APT) family kinase protein